MNSMADDRIPTNQDNKVGGHLSVSALVQNNQWATLSSLLRDKPEVADWSGLDEEGLAALKDGLYQHHYDLCDTEPPGFRTSPLEIAISAALIGTLSLLPLSKLGSGLLGLVTLGLAVLWLTRAGRTREQMEKYFQSREKEVKELGACVDAIRKKLQKVTLPLDSEERAPLLVHRHKACAKYYAAVTAKRDFLVVDLDAMEAYNRAEKAREYGERLQATAARTLKTHQEYPA